MPEISDPKPRGRDGPSGVSAAVPAQSRAGQHGTFLYTAFGITGLQSLTGSGVQKILPIHPTSCCSLSRKPFNAQAAPQTTKARNRAQAVAGSLPADEGLKTTCSGQKSPSKFSCISCHPLPTYILLHGYQLGVHALLLPLHHLDVGQQLGYIVLPNLYVLVLYAGYLGMERKMSVGFSSYKTVV